MKKLLKTLALSTILLAAGNAMAQAKEVVIAYQDMVVPWRYAQDAQALEKKTGYKVSFRKLASGADVIRALASGSVQIGEAGSAPIASGLSQGLDIQLFWILDNINDAEALVARNGSGVASLADLKGKRLAVPFVSTSHFHTLLALENAKVDPRGVKIVNLRPPEIAAAWERGDIDATFIWDPVLAKAKKSGTVLTTSGRIARETGKATFDGIVVTKAFARDNDAFLTDLVKVLAETDDSYRKNKAAWNADSAQVKAVAKWSGAEAAEVPASLALYEFPTLQQQASAEWLGGGAAKSLAATAAFLKSQGTIQNVLPDYAAGVNATWVNKAKAGQ
ncbi:taurine ABC transporter substrate-binding protein [Herbaspirillum robiniae]|uniref:Taurine ABC transporter substrate-binding protein n=1 Tax=Herbaspirillum robiniae TaxID=2014887 RepID=A0A246WT43_9BURK|nr:taurine ABC transporter substrate-binding protein [Herbaspirillum robiniae]NUU03670.1 taurine ABC transporter substrate-binding protein [Herbaspirillum robiniae]OWY30149.1 taurine ABC transporter substrate-binding protein [Herbaspirillum robiniae]